MSVLNSMVVEFDIVSQSIKQLSLDEFSIVPEEVSKIYWIHCDLNQQDSYNKIIKKLGLPKTVTDLCNTDVMTSLIDDDDALTIKLQALTSTAFNKDNQVSFSPFILHFTSRYCFTAAYDSLPCLIAFSHAYLKAIKFAETSGFILFLLLDNIVNEYGSVILSFELMVDDMDSQEKLAQKNFYTYVTQIKQQVIKTKRYLMLIRDILTHISGRKISVISSSCKLSLMSLVNYAHQVVHESDSVRDMLNGLLDQIDNMLMQQMNETMRILTIVSVLVLPISIISGIYGMNFPGIPEFTWKYGYFFTIGEMAVSTIILLLIFKKIKWF